jgi:hypothetical protein
MYLVAFVAASLPLVQACSFQAPQALKTPKGMYEILNRAPYASDSTISGERWRVIDAPRLKVDHGFTCARADHAASQDYIGVRLQDHAVLPTGWEGTVLLNGWHLEYGDEDHHVVGLGSVIFNIARNSDALTWEAGGVIADHNGDDEFGWCYNYTVVAWAKGEQRIDMSAIHADATGRLVFPDRRVQSRYNRTKQAVFRAPVEPKGRLLAGFATTFDDDDHHLLQFGLDLDEAEVSRNLIRWNSRVILKDNSHRRYGVGQLATVVTGKSVRVWKPEKFVIEEGHLNAPLEVDNDLQLTPRDDVNVCLGGPSQSIYSVRIDDVPFDYGVPMLTGWDVGLFCDDEHVKKIGSWIEDWSWHRNQGDATGTIYLTMRTILEDKEPDSPLADGMQFEVLGID